MLTQGDEGEFDLKKVKEFLINQDHIVNLTFEIYRNYENGIEDDIRNMKYFHKL